MNTPEDKLCLLLPAADRDALVSALAYALEGVNEPGPRRTLAALQRSVMEARPAIAFAPEPILNFGSESVTGEGVWSVTDPLRVRAYAPPTTVVRLSTPSVHGLRLEFSDALPPAVVQALCDNTNGRPVVRLVFALG